MNSVLILILSIPLIEIYLFIKIGSSIGAFNTISLILLTAIIGVAYARYEGFNTLKSGLSQLMKNEIPLYEIVSGAAIAIAALLLIVPGFFTDLIGFLLLIPITRKVLFKLILKNKKGNSSKSQSKIIDGEIVENKKDEL